MLGALRSWLDSWRGIGDVERGMANVERGGGRGMATKRAFEDIHEELLVTRRALRASERAFGPIEELSQALLTGCEQHGTTCLQCLRDRTEELIDSLVTLATIAEEERGVCDALPAFKRFVRYLQAEEKLIPYVRREPEAEAWLRRQAAGLLDEQR